MNQKINKKKELQRLEKKIKFTKGLFALSILCILIIFVTTSLSEILEDGQEVQPRSELTYYLNVSYDGIDKNGVKSDSSKVSEIRSGDLFIEDKLPEGLEFIGFTTTNNGSFGAVQRSDKKTLCTGKVVDDTNDLSTSTGTWNADKTEYTYHGLHYDALTRTVTFRVRNLQAGCELTVGIITKTPKIDDPNTPEVETRRDFYNFATAREQDLTVKSNTVHAYMGKMLSPLHNVTYVYEGQIPENAPSPPEKTSYIAGATVGVEANMKIDGYEFSGWTSTDVSITNNRFTMPDKDIIFKGGFTKISKNKVIYKITGTIPDDYVIPTTKEYVKGASVDLDILKEGDIINGYRFLGWKTSDVEIDSDNKFIMSESDITITGAFEEVKYKVFYQFYDTTLPPNWSIFLPTTKEYKPGEIVVLEDIVEPEREPNYTFLGWNSDKEFEMPENDVTIYGEWKKKPIPLRPTITTEILNEKTYFRIGDIVNIKVTVKNNSTMSIQNVLVQETLDSIEIVESDNYEIKSEHFINIKKIENTQSVSIYINYLITESNKENIITHEEIKGIELVSGESCELADDRDYTSSATIKLQSKLKLCNLINGVGPNNKFQFYISGVENGYDTWINLEKNSCETTFLNPGIYKIKEIIPQEYNLVKVENGITKNNSNLNILENNNYEITFTNEFKKKGFYHSFGRSTFKILQRRKE